MVARSGIDRLRRVVWRLQELHTATFRMKQLRNAIMHECGIDERTISNAISKLKELRFIKKVKGSRRVYEILQET